MHKPMKNSGQPEQLFVPDNTHLEITYREFSDTFKWNYKDDMVVYFMSSLLDKKQNKNKTTLQKLRLCVRTREIYEQLVFLMDLPCDPNQAIMHLYGAEAYLHMCS